MIVTAQQARDKGLKRYFTGKPCKRGHICERLVCNNSCVECMDMHRTAWRRTEAYQKTRRARYEKRRVDEPALILYNGSKARAKREGVPFSITVQDILDVWPSDEKCPALGTEFKISMNPDGGHYYPSENSPSLDKIVPSLGYVVGNIAVVSLKANQIKNAASSEEIRKVADWLDSMPSKSSGS